MSVGDRANVQRVGGSRERARTTRNGTPPRVTRTPATITTPTTTWPGRIGSERKIAARATASAGTRNWSASVRVGPISRTPIWTTTFATPAASNPEYRTAPMTGPVIADGPAFASWTTAIG